MSALHDPGCGPAVSIIIPSRFRADLLAVCLTSIIRHATSAIEIIVIDDGSESGLISRATQPFPHVKCIRNESPQGFATAVQQGIDASLGEIVHLLNDDTRVEAGWLDRPLACFADPRVGAVTPLVLIDNGLAHPLIDSAGDGFSLAGRAFKRSHRRPRPPRMKGCWVFGASGSSAFYRRSALKAVGGFPVEFGAYYEDVEVSWRLQRAGWRIWFAPESVVWHKVTSSYSNIMIPELVMKMVKNQESVYLRNRLMLYWNFGWMLHGIYLMARLMKAMVQCRSYWFLQGLLLAWREQSVDTVASTSGDQKFKIRIPLDLI